MISKIKKLGLFVSKWNTIPLARHSAINLLCNESIQICTPAIYLSYDEKTGWSLIGSQLWTNWKEKTRQLL